MIGGMELDLIDPMAEAVVGSQLGQMAIGRPGELLALLGTDDGAGEPELFPSPVRADARTASVSGRSVVKAL